MSEHLLDGIGRKIKACRKAKGLKLYEVASRADVSNGLLSKIENGRTVPSLPVLISIVKALEIRMEDFFEGMEYEPEKNFIHKPKAEYFKIEKEDNASGFDYFQVLSKTLEGRVVDVNILELEPGAKREMVTTDAWELKYVIDGEIEYHIGKEIIHLKKGDTLFYNGKQEHVPKNHGQEKARMLVVYLFNSERD